MTLQLEHQRVPERSRFAAEGQEGRQSASLLHQVGELDLEFAQSTLEVFANSLLAVFQIVFPDNFVLGGSELGAHRVAEESVEVAVGLRVSRIVPVVEATGEHTLGKGDEVRRRGQFPVFVRPEVASAAHSSLDLVDDHEDA